MNQNLWNGIFNSYYMLILEERKSFVKGLSNMEERKIHFDLLRIFAIFAMVTLHVAAQFWYAVPVSSNTWKWFNFYDSLVRFCVPIMVMISGVFFLDPQKELNMRVLFKKYIARIAIAFLFWSMLYVLPIYFRESITSRTPIRISTVLLKLFDGNYHMWFMYMIIGLYMITPFLRRIVLKKELLQYFIVLWFVFGILETFSATAFKSEGMEAIGNVIDKLHLFLVLGYSGYFVLGWYLYQYPVSKRQEYWIYCLGIAGAIITISFTDFLSMQRNEPVDQFYDYLSPNVLLSSLAIFVFFQNRVSKWKFSPKSRERIIRTSLSTFGVYLIHILFLDFLSICGLNTLIFHAALSVPFLSVLVFCISLFSVTVLRKIPLFRKFLT